MQKIWSNKITLKYLQGYSLSEIIKYINKYTNAPAVYEIEQFIATITLTQKQKELRNKIVLCNDFVAMAREILSLQDEVDKLAETKVTSELKIREAIEKMQKLQLELPK